MAPAEVEDTLRKIVAVVLAIAFTVALAQPATAATTYSIRGTVVCPSGLPVVGVWMQSSGGGSGFASWTRYPGRSHVARYSRTFSTNLSSGIYLNVGCGGSTSAWSTSNRTPSKTVSSGRILFMNARCNTSTRTCAFPPLENNTPAAPSTNPFYDSTRSDPRRDGTGWCTYRAAAFWQTMTGRYPNWRGDAGYWDNNAAATGWRVEGVPFPDSIAVWQPGTASSFGHVGYVADVRVSSGRLEMKIYDRNWDGRGGDRNGAWVPFTDSSMRFIVAPPQVESTVR